MRYRRRLTFYSSDDYRRRNRRRHSPADGRWIRPEFTPHPNANGRVELTVDEWYHVFKRHGSTCHLCGKPINDRLTFPNNMSRTVDHLVPVSRGGDNTIDNLRPAHLECNTVRSNLALSGRVRTEPIFSSLSFDALFAALASQSQIPIAGGLWLPVLNAPIPRWKIVRCRIARFLLRNRQWTLLVCGIIVSALFALLVVYAGVTVDICWLVVVVVGFSLAAGFQILEFWANPYQLAKGRVLGWEFEEATRDESSPS